MVTSWAHSSAGFSNTSRTRRALKGLQRGCLGGDRAVSLQGNTATVATSQAGAPSYHSTMASSGPIPAGSR